MLKRFPVDEDAKRRMVGEIQNYFLEERGEEIGDLAALLVLEFFAEKLAPQFYNYGVQDAHEFLSQRIEDVFELMR